jgi:hypothetical protein
MTGDHDEMQRTLGILLAQSEARAAQLTRIERKVDRHVTDHNETRIMVLEDRAAGRVWKFIVVLMIPILSAVALHAVFQ